jgi:hypothetical protein
MKKSLIFLSLAFLGLMSCTRKFTCECDYKQRAIGVDSQGNPAETRTDEKYSSNIMYTSKKLATEECNERGRSIAIDTMRVEVSCKVLKGE